MGCDCLDCRNKNGLRHAKAQLQVALNALDNGDIVEDIVSQPIKRSVREAVGFLRQSLDLIRIEEVEDD